MLFLKFTPGILAPMGLPKNVRVIMWGLSLERPTMVKYRIKNIRDLFENSLELLADYFGRCGVF